MLPSGLATRLDVTTGVGIRPGTTAVMVGMVAGTILGTLTTGRTTVIMVGIIPGIQLGDMAGMILGTVLGILGTPAITIPRMLSAACLTALRPSVEAPSAETDRPTETIVRVSRRVMPAVRVNCVTEWSTVAVAMAEPTAPMIGIEVVAITTLVASTAHAVILAASAARAALVAALVALAAVALVALAAVAEAAATWEEEGSFQFIVHSLRYIG